MQRGDDTRPQADLDRHFQADEIRVTLKRFLTDATVSWVEEKRRDDVLGPTVVSSTAFDRTFMLRVEAVFESSCYEQLLDVLHVHLQERQKDWHELLLPGGRVWPVGGDGNTVRTICRFSYRSPWPLSPRDTLYAAEADIIPESQSFELRYWTIDDDVLCPVPEGMVRIDFQAAHLVRRTEQGCLYRYIQTSDAKIPLMPDVLLQKIQVGILMDEVSGLRACLEK